MNATRYSACGGALAPACHKCLLRAGKVAWAASLLYTVTAEPVYRNLATTIGDNIIAQQHEDGCWGMAGMSSNDATAEMVYWMDQVHQAVGG